VGIIVGWRDGVLDGERLDGFAVGIIVGFDGLLEGENDGFAIGVVDGRTVGLVGLSVARTLGLDVTKEVGFAVE